MAQVIKRSLTLNSFATQKYSFASLRQRVHQTALIESWSRLKASIINTNNGWLERGFPCFHAQNRVLNRRCAIMCTRSPREHFSSILCSLMRFKAIMPLRITRVMITAHPEWCDLDLTPAHPPSPPNAHLRRRSHLKCTLHFARLILARYNHANVSLTNRWSGQLPHLFLWQPKNNIAVWGRGCAPVSSLCISSVPKGSKSLLVDSKW